jgi:hypothetical protein
MIFRLIRNGSGLLLLALLMAPCLLGGELPVEVASWEGLMKDSPAVLDRERWQGLVKALKGNGFSCAEARGCLEPVADAAREGLPPDAVLARMEEGAAKKAEADIMLKAGRSRLAALRTAADVLKETGYGARKTENDNLLKTVAVALESGLGAVTVKPVLARGNGGQPGRMQSIVEAGEIMRLNDMDDATVGPMLSDFIDRNLRRSEVLRAARYAVQQHSAHVDGARIRQRLWGREGAGGGADAGEGKRQGSALKIEAATPAGRGSIHVGSDGAGDDGLNGNKGGPDNRPVTPGPVAPGPDQQGRRQNGRK